MNIIATPEQLKPADYASDQEVRWCPGCGDYAILKSVQKTMAELQLPPEKVVFISGIRVAGQARDRLGRLLAVGVVVMLFSHVFVNIGMNIRLMPVTGVPLPLLSYGGTSIVCSLLALGLLQNIQLHQRSI